MAKQERTRMYCHPDFKKLLDIRRIESGETDTISFTKKVSINPSILTRETNDKKKNKYSIPTLF